MEGRRREGRGGEEKGGEREGKGRGGEGRGGEGRGGDKRICKWIQVRVQTSDSPTFPSRCQQLSSSPSLSPSAQPPSEGTHPAGQGQQ